MKPAKQTAKELRDLIAKQRAAAIKKTETKKPLRAAKATTTPSVPLPASDTADADVRMPLAKSIPMIIIMVEPSLGEHCERIRNDIRFHPDWQLSPNVAMADLFGYAMIRWDFVSQTDVSQLVNDGEDNRKSFLAGLAARDGKISPPPKRKRQAIRCYSIRGILLERYKAIANQYFKKGVPSSKFAATTSAIYRQAIRRWDTISKADVQGFIDFLAKFHA
jgi:hypothetical protein